MIGMNSYLQNEDLTNIAVKLGSTIYSNETLQSYCEMHFGKKMSVFVGVQEPDLLNESLAPFCFIHDMGKAEGAERKRHQYQAVFGVGLSIHEEDAVFEGVRVTAGHQRVSEVLTLIQDALNGYKGGCMPPNEIEQNVIGMPGNNPHFWQGFLFCVWSLDTSIGGHQEF